MRASTRPSARQALVENISKGYVSRILRLALPAPDIVEAIFTDSMDQGMMLENLERPLRACWGEQRRQVLGVRS